MRNKVILVSIVAATLTGVNVASAQTTTQPDRPPAAQQHAPAEKVAPPIRSTTPGTDGQAKHEDVQPDMKAGNDANTPSDTTGQTPRAMDPATKN